jgi:hypothetical protein
MEFFEVVNTGSQSVSLNGVEIGGFSNTPYAFAPGLTLAAGQRIIVARDPAVFETVYGSGHNVAPNGFEPDNLSNSGELVTLLGPLGELIQSFTYDSTSPWPTAPDGMGSSLEIVDPLGDSTSPANWRASAYTGGSPGASGVVGDYDGNNLVDDADYQTWRSSFDLTVPRGTGADGNRNGIVDTSDYIVWRKARNTAPAPTQAASIAVASSQGSSLPASPVASVSGNDVGNKRAQSPGAIRASLFTPSTSGLPNLSGQPAAISLRATPEVAPRDLALLLALELGVSSPINEISAVAPDRREPLTDDSIEWIDDAFASLTLL